MTNPIHFDGGSDADRTAVLAAHDAYLHANAAFDWPALKPIWSDDPTNVFFNMNGHTYVGLEHWSRLWQYYARHKESGWWQPFDVTPNVDVGYDVTSRFNLSVEYYGATGTINRIDPIAEQEHQLYLATNIDFGPEWEFNFGYGTALTAGGDKSIVKMILGRRIGGKKSLSETSTGKP